LDDNSFSEIPPVIMELQGLEELHMSWNNLICIPPEIVRLKNLTCLDLSGNKITKIPDEIGDLSKLREIYLDANPIDSISLSIHKLVNLDLLSINHDIRIMQIINSLPKTVEIRTSNYDFEKDTFLP
jgi:internalin A